MSASFFEVRNLSVSYPERSFTYNFSCERGEIVGLFGASGTGKTTFFRAVTGLEKNTGGQIFLDGRDITKFSVQKRKIGYVFQDYAIFDSLTVAGNLKFVLFANRIKHKFWKEKVEESLKSVRLENLSSRSAGTLSGGEKQRLALARSVIVPPDMLLLDEPFNSLDAEVKSFVAEHLKTLSKEMRMPVIIVSHNREELEEFATRIVTIADITSVAR